MADRPILFSASMVRALLAGRKTQTRRVLKGVPDWCGADRRPGFSCLTPAGHIEFRGDYPGDDQVEAGYASKFIKLPFVKGDRLWVKETWRTHKVADELPPRLMSGEGRVWYEADRDNCDAHGKVRVSIHMPRWASRLSLTVTNVRVERLIDCSADDAQAEGLEWVAPGKWAVDRTLPIIGDDPCRVYADLWNHINGAGAWENNPWVVAVTFTVEQRNIDA